MGEGDGVHLCPLIPDVDKFTPMVVQAGYWNKVVCLGPVNNWHLPEKIIDQIPGPMNFEPLHMNHGLR